MNARAFDERDIHLSLDGELPDEDRAAFERWLNENPDMKAKSERYAVDAAALHALLDPVLEEPIPPRLLARPRPLVATGRNLRVRALAAAAIFLVGLGAGYAASTLTGVTASSPVALIAGEAVEAHTIYAAEKLHVVEVGADQKDHLVGWLSKRVGTRLVAPDFEAQGFSLIGGRLLPAAKGVAAQFMYQNQAGDRISLYVTHGTDSAETGFRLYDRGGARAFYWLDDGFGYAVAGAVEEPVLLNLANEAYRQLLGAELS